MANERIKECIQRSIDDLTAVKDSIIATGIEVAEGTPSSQYADKVAEVYEKGKSEGGGDTEAAYAQGKADEQRAFWETFQAGGTRGAYSNAFNGAWWTDEIYNPIYPFDSTVTNLSNPFYAMYNNSEITDTKQPIIFSEVGTKSTYLFANCRKLKIIRSLTICEGSGFGSWFQNCVALEELNVYGTIGQNGFDVKWSTLLTHDSLMSIINALSSTTTDLTVTLSLNAVNNAFETETGLADGSTSAEWLELIGSKPNWTITLK